MRFPAGFRWGAASSAYQIEGAWNADGKGPGIWDVFCRQPGKIRDGHTGETACDHYHRWREDVELLHSLGVDAYRFSISWPRVIPGGTGRVNEAGLAFYDRLVDALLHCGIEPWVTLFHWDFPQALQERGGWLVRESADWFAEYTTTIVNRLSDRVRHWMPLNEPQVFIGFGHVRGEHAPGLRLSLAETLQAAHHVLLAHGSAVRVIRETAKTPPWIGIANVGVIAVPETPRHIEAARHRMFEEDCTASADAGFGANIWSNTWWADPVFLGHYPEHGIRAAGAAMPVIEPGDMELISQPIDFIGTNIYTGTVVRAGPNGSPATIPPTPATPFTGFSWPVVPQSLRWGPRFLHERYGKPIVITENGLALPDWVALDGHVHDPQRIDFLTRYLRELNRAMEDGTRIDGYFQWSILDNFEWAEGYHQRFGLVHVDFETMCRTPKDSAMWYRDLIARQKQTATDA
ncbi:MAG: GH1 family beta-glucosidase [Verrucomicrobiota bacterium]